MSRLSGLALLIGSAVAVAAPGGRVVRIERAVAQVAPRLCEIHGDTGTCLGDRPRSGQSAVVLDEHRAVAEFEIVDAVSYSPDCPTLWTVKTRAAREPAVASEGLAVIDPALDPRRARVIEREHLPTSPSGLPDDEVWRAIDRDGDGTADILLTRYSCDASGRPATGASYCIDVWARTGARPGARMTRTTQINFARCRV